MSESLENQKLWFKDKIIGVDTFSLCNHFGLLPATFGYSTYRIKRNLNKTSMFGSQDNSTNKDDYEFEFVPSGPTSTLELLMDDDRKKEMFGTCIKELVESGKYPQVNNFRFAKKEVCAGGVIVTCSDNITLIIINNIYTSHSIVVCSSGILGHITGQSKQVEETSLDFLTDYMKARYKVDITIHLSKAMRDSDYITKLVEYANDKLPKDRVVLSRPNEINHVLMYTEKSLDNCAVTVESSVKARKEHWKGTSTSMSARSVIKSDVTETN